MLFDPKNTICNIFLLNECVTSSYPLCGISILHPSVFSNNIYCIFLICHYQLRYYAEGERIDTKEPCLNCTCNNSMLMCYLKVCPFSKPIGKDCTVEKSPDQCCPVITCPQVPVNLQVMHMTSTTSTSAPVSSSTSEIVSYTEHGCSIDGQYYPDGAQVPGDHRKPCELCYCIRNHTACIMQECILKVEGCEPVFVDGICCPVRYKCAHDKEMEQITTTTVAPNGTLITTTIQPPSDGDCYHNNEFYTDGELIQSENPCEHCYCMNSDVVCAIQECRSPLDEEDENCIPRTPPPGQCCPEAYDCPEAPEHTTLKYEPSVTEVVSPEVPEEKLPVTSLAPETTEKEELITKDITDTTDSPVKEVTIKDIELETTPVTLTEDVKTPDEGIQIDTTITSVVDEEKETIIETTLSPVPEEESDLDSTFDIPLEEEVEPTLDTTFGPSIEDEKEPSADTTLAPVSIDEEEPSLYTTSAPVDEVETEVSVDTTLSPATAEEKEPSLKPTLAPVAEIEKEPPIDSTLSPVAEDEEPSIDSTLSPKIQDKETVKETTLATAIEDEKEPITDTTIAPLDEEEELPVETTLSPEIEEEPVIDATSVPVTEEEKPSVDTTISPAPEKEEPTVDTTLSPEIEEPAIDVTMVPVDEEIELDVDTTVSPTPEEKEPSIETTIAPATEEKEPSIDTTSPPAIPETEAPSVPLEEEKEPIEPITTAPVTDVDEVTFEDDAIDTTISPVDEEKEIPDHTGIDIIPVTTSIPEETDDTVTETFETDPFMLETRTSGLSPTTKPMVDDSELTTLKSVDDETIPEEIQPSLDITTVPSKLDTTEYEADKVSPESQTEIIQETTPETDAFPEEITPEKDEHLAVEPEVPEILLTTEPPREDVTSIIVDETATGKPEIQERTTLLDKVDEQDTTVEVLASTDPSILPEEETEKAIIEDEAETETEYPKVDITTDEYEIKTTVKPLDIDESKYEVPDKPLVVTAVPEDVADITTQVQLEETSEIYHDITAQPELSSPETTEILEEKEPTKTVSPSGLEEILTSSVRPQVTEDVTTLEPSTEEDKIYEEITPTYEGVTSPEVDISPVSTDSPTKLETTPSTEKERVTTPKETIEDKEDEITIPEIETEPPVLISDEEFQTELEAKPSPNCFRNGTQYYDGDYVPSKDICTDCYCLYGEIVCAYIECPKT
ncbi:hypothetical protein Anas_03426 [Armadillidium nasatum]|uniref:VWFC domain-containing protein n=1 Tax=Armadillidium nasatum TaxID=96803 RepID=A0A5N5TB28_9CRUS|nr:hypothetical protein Anas_03426 [Armadillidium nasatum]